MARRATWSFGWRPTRRRPPCFAGSSLGPYGLLHGCVAEGCRQPPCTLSAGPPMRMKRMSFGTTRGGTGRAIAGPCGCWLRRRTCPTSACPSTDRYVSNGRALAVPHGRALTRPMVDTFLYRLHGMYLVVLAERMATSHDGQDGPGSPPASGGRQAPARCSKKVLAGLLRRPAPVVGAGAGGGVQVPPPPPIGTAWCALALSSALVRVRRQGGGVRIARRGRQGALA